MNNWSEVTLNECISTLKGYAFKSEWYLSHGIPLVRVSDFTENSVSTEKIKFISEDLCEIYKKYGLKENDIIIQTVGSWQHNPSSIVGKVVRIPSNLEGALLNQNAVKITPNSKIDLDFLYYLLKEDNFKFHNLNNAQGAANQASITLSSIKSFKFKLPDMQTQKKIGKILITYDQLIKNNLKRIELLQEAGKLIYEDWFSNFKIDGKKLKIDKKTNLPLGWENKSITEFNSFKQDLSIIKKFIGEKIYYATADIENSTITGNGVNVNWGDKPSRAKIKPSNNTVWFARMSNTNKILCFNSKNLKLQEKIILSSGFAGFKAIDDTCLPYLYFTINSQIFNEMKNLYATGATQVSLSNESLKAIKMNEPDLALIKKFGFKTLHLIERMSILMRKTQLLKEARDILVPRLISGIIDTKELENLL